MLQYVCCTGVPPHACMQKRLKKAHTRRWLGSIMHSMCVHYLLPVSSYHKCHSTTHQACMLLLPLPPPPGTRSWSL